jgi:endoglucanase
MKKTLLLYLLLISAVVLAQNTEIRYNQVGCYPQQEKVIVVEGMNPIGKVRLTMPDGKTIKPKLQVHKALSSWSGKTRYVVDLGDLTATGNYHINVGNATCDLNVNENPFCDVAKASLRLFYLIRSGVAIEDVVYSRPVGHPDTKVLVHNSAASRLRPAGTVISSPYGWYDAGDYNKYVVNSAFSIGLMFAAYEAQPNYFAKLQTNIPESGNNTPDLLDEMMFNLRWFLTMQDPSDGGVYHKLTTPHFEGFIMPTECHQSRYVVAKSVTATLDFTAVMADAARIFEPFQDDYPGFSAIVAGASERAYQWAKEHPKDFYRQEQLKDPTVSTGGYGDGNAADEFFWAASALYRLTGKQQYLDDARQYQPQRFTTPTWVNVASLGAFEWLAAGESPLRETMLGQLTAYCDEAIKSVDGSCFQSPFGNKRSDFGWGCLAENCCCQGLVLLYADKMLGKNKYSRYALQNADYLFGRNATGYCYVTGFGKKSPMHPHHRISAADTIKNPFPGMLVGGPNPGQQDKKELPTPYLSDYPDESYLDITQSYASNEIAINWNASLVAFLCWLDAESCN